MLIIAVPFKNYSTIYITTMKKFCIQSALLLSLPLASYAQNNSVVQKQSYVHTDIIDQQTLPADTALRQGVLENGFTYYVIRNDKEKNRSDLRLLVRAGSLLEKDNERGIAHFVEHMFVKGSKHFPGLQSLEFMHRNGISFGHDSNAGTGHGTVRFMLNNIPTENTPLLDSCLLLLRDVAGDMTISKEAVKSEHNVIVEEWRQLNIYSIGQQLHKDLLGNSLYAQRSPIGDVDIVGNCSRKLVRNFYRRWYQPQNEAIVVVGDFDPDRMVEKVRTLFGNMKRGSTVAPPFPSFPESDAPRFTFYQDENISCHSVAWIFRLPEISVGEMMTVGGQRKVWLRNRVRELLERKLAKLAQNHSDLLNASTDLIDISDTEKQQCMLFGMQAPTDKWQQGTEKLAMMLEHIRRHGFKDEDWKEAGERREPMYNADSTAILWNDTTLLKPQKEENREITERLTQCFFRNKQYSNSRNTILAGYHFANSVTGEQLHETFKEIANSNNVLVATIVPRNSTLPQESEVRGIFERVKAMSDEELASVDVRKAQRLGIIQVDSMDFNLTPGTVEKTIVHNDSTTELWLSNGIKVMMLKRKNGFRHLTEREYEMRIARPSGYSVLSDDDFPYRTMLSFSSCVRQYESSGIKNNVFVTREFEDYFSTSVFPDYISDDASYMEKYFKAMYATLTSTEVDSVAFEEELNDMRADALTHANPMSQAFNRLNSMHLQGLQRDRKFQPEDVAKLNINRFREVVKDYCSNYNGSVMYVVGIEGLDSVVPFLLKYVATLPSKPEPVKRAVWPANHYKTTNSTHVEKVSHSSPLCLAYLCYTWEKGFVYNAEQHAKNEVLRYVISHLLVNKLRIQHSDVYTPSCDITENQYPVNQMQCNIAFSCNPTQRERIVQDAKQIIEEMANGNLITQQFIDNYMKNREKEKHEENNFDRLRSLMEKDMGYVTIDPNDLSYLKKVTPASLKVHVRQLLKQGNVHVGYFTTE